MIAIIGYFAEGRDATNGQTIKTRIIADQLEAVYGTDAIRRVDTCRGLRFLLRLPFVAKRTLSDCDSVVMLPAQNGVHIIPLVFVLINLFYHRRLLYVVIGGWLHVHTKYDPILRLTLRRMHRIFPETLSMEQALSRQGISNVAVMPNTKPLPIVDSSHFTQHSSPIRLCTFSRVSEDKGVGDAVKAVMACNEQLQRTAFTLHIYGQVAPAGQSWFNKLQQSFPAYVKYCGTVDYQDSVGVLCNYSALLFPTYYHGECFAGTFLDAFAAGLPVIASDWHDNGDIIRHGETGFIFPTHSVDALRDILVAIAENPDQLQPMREACLKCAHEYQPENVIRTLTLDIDH